MIRHIIKLIWNRRRSLAWIFTEQSLVFAVMLFIFTTSVNKVTQYYSKGNLNMKDISFITFMELNRDELEEDEKDANHAQFKNMVVRMKEWPTVELVSINANGATPGTGNLRRDSISFNDGRYMADIKFCDENYYRIFSPKLTEGEWFRDDDVSEIPPALITQRLAERIGLTGSAIGQNIYYNGIVYRITGVVEAFKMRSTQEQTASLFLPFSVSANTGRNWECVVKFKPGMRDDFSRAFLTEFYRNFPRDQVMPAIIDLDKLNVQMQFLEFKLFFFILMIPTAFLLIFAFLGTFGLVWVQSKKRMSELGLRMALGCTPARLQRTIIFENLILTNFAMLPGLIVMANLYAFAPKGWEWIVAVGAAIVLMWLFAAFSAWYPARKAAKVQPVEALRQNQ